MPDVKCTKNVSIVLALQHLVTVARELNRKNYLGTMEQSVCGHLGLVLEQVGEFRAVASTSAEQLSYPHVYQSF